MNNSRGSVFWHNFFMRQESRISTAIILAALVVAILGPSFPGVDLEANYDVHLAPPSRENLMGTDHFGRDYYSRVVVGTRLSMIIAAGSAAISLMMGIVLGSIPGYFGGLVDDLMTRTADLFMLMPAFFLALIVLMLFGSSTVLTVAVIGFTSWPRSARLMRAEVLRLKERTFVQAARAAGASDWSILVHHIIPNGLPPVLTYGAILMGRAVILQASLSYLGLGDPLAISWGRMIREGQMLLMEAPWLSLFPGAFMVILVTAFNLFSDGLNSVLNPRLQRRIEVRLAAEKIRTGQLAVPHVESESAFSTPVIQKHAEPPILRVDNLRMWYLLSGQWVRAVDGVSFSLGRGTALGVVGESGCGKTSIALTLMRLLPSNARIISGEINLKGEDLTQLGEDQFRRVRWSELALVFQGAMNSLNPVVRVGLQLARTYRLHRPDAAPEEVNSRIRDLFDLVGVPRSYVTSYPHELSGGMRQRVVIALSLLLKPDIIIADEPTTGLDVLVQDQVLGEIEHLKETLNLSLLLISHDIGIVGELCDRIAVMYAGEIVEMGSPRVVLSEPRHPYTKLLLGALPTLHGEQKRLETIVGRPPSLVVPPMGCRFHPRCKMYAAMPSDDQRTCREKSPRLQVTDGEHLSACHFADVMR